MILRVISLGAGVQSTTMALMAASGEISPMPDHAVFADTGWEPKAVYDHLDWLETQLPFPVHRVARRGADLGQHAINVATKPITRTASPPWFTENPRGMLPRQCSDKFKVEVIHRKVRELLGLKPGERSTKGSLVEQWIGISQDEMQRMKNSKYWFVTHRWPLIERQISRRDCLSWMQRHGFPRPPKSACIFCPYHGNEQWREMRDNAPDDWQRAIEFDTAIRSGFYGMDGEAFVHRQRVPLDKVDLSTLADHGQIEFGFLQECEGMCGV